MFRGEQDFIQKLEASRMLMKAKAVLFLPCCPGKSPSLEVSRRHVDVALRAVVL